MRRSKSLLSRPFGPARGYMKRALPYALLLGILIIMANTLLNTHDDSTPPRSPQRHGEQYRNRAALPKGGLFKTMRIAWRYFFDKPIKIDQDLRAQLEVFRARQYDTWAWFVPVRADGVRPRL